MPVPGALGMVWVYGLVVRLALSMPSEAGRALIAQGGVLGGGGRAGVGLAMLARKQETRL